MSDWDNLNKQKMALESVLLFHGAGPWDDSKKKKWDTILDAVLGPCDSRLDYEGFRPTNEATTRNLCRVVRKALSQ